MDDLARDVARAVLGQHAAVQVGAGDGQVLRQRQHELAHRLEAEAAAGPHDGRHRDAGLLRELLDGGGHGGARVLEHALDHAALRGRQLRHALAQALQEMDGSVVHRGPQKRVLMAPLTARSSSTSASQRHLSKVVQGCEMPSATRSPTCGTAPAGSKRR